MVQQWCIHIRCAVHIYYLYRQRIFFKAFNNKDGYQKSFAFMCKSGWYPHQMHYRLQLIFDIIEHLSTLLPISGIEYISRKVTIFDKVHTSLQQILYTSHGWTISYMRCHFNFQVWFMYLYYRLVRYQFNTKKKEKKIISTSLQEFV